MMAWHRQALNDVRNGLEVDVTSEPACGWFRTRLVKGGPFVGARIWLQQFVCPDTGDLVADEYYCCEIDGRPCDAHEQWPWLCTRPITEQEFDYLTAAHVWAREHAPSDPFADASKPVDWKTLPPPEF